MRSQLRARFLLVMGLPSIAACSKDTSGTITPTPSANATVATASATATATATASASATATASASAGRIPNGASGGGGCGTVIVCSATPKVAPKEPAPAPYQACAASVPANVESDPPHGIGLFDPDATKEKRQLGNTCCYKAPRAGCGGGRPLRGVEGPIVAALVPTWDWVDRAITETPAVADATLAERFLVDARFEHASVASFARASLQLLALGAPPDLVAATHAAALDEIAHARTCFALAARRGANASSPGPLAIDQAPFAATLDAFVRDTFLDGCVAETLSAVEVHERASGDEVERAALSRIADDEARHAELAWRMLAWAVRTGGAPARAALADVLATLDPSDPLVDEVVRPSAFALLADATPPSSAGATPGESSFAPTPTARL